MNHGETRHIKFCKEEQADPKVIINCVFKALKEKGYNPITLIAPITTILKR